MELCSNKMGSKCHNEIRDRHKEEKTWSPIASKRKRERIQTQCHHIKWNYKQVLYMTNQQNDYAPSEDSDQFGHPPSLIRVFAVRMKKAWVLSYPWAHSKDSDQTRRMPRLMWVFAGRTATFFFFMRLLICQPNWARAADSSLPSFRVCLRCCNNIYLLNIECTIAQL